MNEQRSPVATRFTDHTGIFFRNFSPANSQSFWQHVDMNDGRGAQVGPHYRSKAELLADHESYLCRAGWLADEHATGRSAGGARKSSNLRPLGYPPNVDDRCSYSIRDGA